MVVFSHLATALAALTSLTTTLAHPDPNDPILLARQIAIRDFHERAGARSLAECSSTPSSIALRARAAERRAATAQRLRAERGLSNKNLLHRRDFASFAKWNAISHNDTTSGFTLDTPPPAIFGTSSACILTPEGPAGPFYVAQGLLHDNLVEDQSGVPMHLDLQFIDVATCRPADLVVDVWSANATGQYSGVSDPTQHSGLNTTWLRGVLQSDADGVVQFDTLFPGHYAGRATHEHVLAHSGGAILPNGTYAGGRVSHIGQLYFDEALRDVVEAAYPYNTNTLPKSRNLDDFWIAPSATPESDPFLEYVLLGERIEDGILAWMSIGVNASADWSALGGPASYWAADGGHDNPGGGWGGMFPKPGKREAEAEGEAELEAAQD